MKRVNILQSGIPFVDDKWGGFYRGGTYLLIGSKKTGRTLSALQYAMESAAQKEVCLYFTYMKPKDLMINAASIGLDLEYAMNKSLISVVRVAPPTEVYNDEYLAEYLTDVVTVVEQYKPGKIVFDELTPLISFRDVEYLQKVFTSVMEKIEDLGVTSLFILGDPATDSSKTLVDSLAVSSTGIIYLQKKVDEEVPGNKITITPNIGHSEGQFSSFYKIEAHKGMVTLSSSQTDEISASSNGNEDNYLPIKDFLDSGSEVKEYSLSAFRQLLNNQIALYKTAGILFNVVSFKLNSEAEKKGLISLKQFQEALKLSVDKKDVLCFINSKIIVLVSKDESRLVNNLISRIKTHLPQNFLDEIAQYISVYSVKIDDTINNADDIIPQLLIEKVIENELKFK